MALRDIIILPDKRLRLASKPIPRIDGEVRRLVEDMFETMYEAPGIGLAAIQLGIALRVVTMDLSKKQAEATPRTFVNPEIVWWSEEKSIYEEGCLSIPDVHEDVERPARVKLRYLDLEGRPHEEDAEGLFATCIQHEVDHLNGVLFIDHISKLKRDRIVKKFTKAAKRAEQDST
jgi:peptide deformylase